jgi:isopenicillin N synthase-like dioxygenase
MQTLPIIDISPFLASLQDELKKQETALILRKVCREIGFFYLVGHGISHDLIQGAHKQAQQFFSQSQSIKQEISIQNSKHFRGYQNLGENVTKQKRDWHEAIDLFREEPENGKPLHGPNQWPSEPKSFRPFFENYVEEMQKLGNAVMRALAMSLELDEHHFDRFMDKSFWIMRVINYPPLDEQITTHEHNVGDSCGVHTDYGCLTFVNQDETKGALWVQSDSGEWVSADPIEHAFVVNLGDMLKLWTGNLYQSTPHRVVHKGDKARISIPFFFEPNFDAVIEPLPLCENLFADKTPMTFEPRMYGDHVTTKVLGNFTFSNDKVDG